MMNEVLADTFKATPEDAIIAWQRQKKARELQSERLLKAGVWLYFLLLIFEGGLRKWVFPSLASPLLIVRDPIALLLIFSSYSKGILKANPYIIVMSVIGFASFFTAILLGHGNIIIAIYGARILLFHFPLMFIIGKVFTEADVIKVGKFILWLSVPMVILTGLQFYSPQSAWVNRGVGGDIAGAGFSGALGFFRPPGTFSFTTGNATFFALAAFYILYFWTSDAKVNRALLLASSAALIVSIPFSISRTLLFSVGLAVFMCLIGIVGNRKYFGRLIGIVAGTLFLFVLLSQTQFFQTATEALTVRFQTASDAEGGLQGTFGGRFFGGLLQAISNSAQIPFFGYGIGLGTNVASILLTGQATFLIAEDEWGRLIGEMGLLFGLIVIGIRLIFCTDMMIQSFKKIKVGDLLPWMMLGFALLLIPQGQWAQPTALGFSTIGGGLTLAAFNKKTSL